jgi:hypothetical protein
MNQTLQLRKTRDFGEKISDTVKFIRINWLNLFALYGIFVLPFLLVGLYLGVASFQEILTKTTTESLLKMSYLGGKVIFASIFFFMAITGLATSTYLYMDLWDKEGTKPSVGRVIPLFLGSFLSNLLYGFLGLLIMIVVLSPLAAFIFLSRNSPGMIALLMLVLFFVAFFYMIYFFLLYPVNTIDKRGANPIVATWQLLRNKWWSSFGYMCILLLIYYVFSLITNLIIMIVFGSSALINPNSLAASTGKTFAMVYGVSLLIQQIFYVIVFVGIGILYYSLDEEKNGSGLESRIDQIGTRSVDHTRQEDY